MQNVPQKWGKRLVFIKGFIAGAILLLIIIGTYGGTYAVVKQGQCMVQHRAIMSALKEHLGSGRPIPHSLPELASLEYISGSYRFSLSSIVSDPDFKYYPDAWNKHGRIFLQSLICGSYVVTFGDGAMATLSYWYYKPDEKQPDADKLSKEECKLPIMSCINTLPVHVLLVLLSLSFVTIFIVERIIKQRDARA